MRLLRYRLDNEEHAGNGRCCRVRELRLNSRSSRPIGRASRGASQTIDFPSPRNHLALSTRFPHELPPPGRTRREPEQPCARTAQVTAGKDLYVSETTDLVVTGTPDAAGSSEAPAASGTADRPRRRGNGLSGMLLPELQRLAAELGISGTARMRKGDLVAAIPARQVGGGASAGGDAPANGVSPSNGADSTPGVAASAAPLEAPVSGGANGGPVTGTANGTPSASGRTRRGASRPAGPPTKDGADAPPHTPPTETRATATGPTEARSADPPAADPPAADTPAADTSSTDTSSTDTSSTDTSSTDTSSTDTVPAEVERTDGDRPQRNRDRGGRNRDRDGGDRNRDGGGRNRDGGDRNRDGGGPNQRGGRGNQPDKKP